MKRLSIIAVLACGSLWAQSTPPAQSPAATKSFVPGYTQMYCAGFVYHRTLSRKNFVAASSEAPHVDQFSRGETVFLGGPNLAAGERYSILREVVDPNKELSVPEQAHHLRQLGHLYQEIGQVTVSSVHKGGAVAKITFSCDPAVPGDIVVPFEEKPAPPTRDFDPPLEQYLPPTGAARGHILGSKDFVELLGRGNLVYTDFGASKGARPGDYLFIRRGYGDHDLNNMDKISEQLPRGLEPNAVHQARLKSIAKLPSHVLGEALVLSVTEHSSTVVIIRTVAEVQLGDVLEGEGTDGTPVATRTTPEPCKLVDRLRHRIFLGGCQPSK
jgi:hypothetical protein